MDHREARSKYRPPWPIAVNPTVVHNSRMREYPQLRIRLSPELKEKIQNAADKNNRSMNAEITARLEKSFDFSNNPEIKTKLLEINALETVIEELKKREQGFHDLLDDIRKAVKEKTEDNN